MLIKLLQGLLKFKGTSFVKKSELFHHLSNQQDPETLFITCSDSRIVPSLITKASPGDLFSIRNIGNIIPPHPSTFSETAAIEYALNVLNIKDIIVCGHSNCGAMKGLLTPNIKEKMPAVAAWLTHAQDAIQSIQEDNSSALNEVQKLQSTTKKNILLQIEHLKTYPSIKQKLAQKEVNLHGWYYDIEKGEVFIYEPELKDFVDLETALKRAIQMRKEKIVSTICMAHLQLMLPVKSKEEYQQLIKLLTELQENILPIWDKIKEHAKQQLWKELGGFYVSQVDETFIGMVESSSMIQLKHLEEFHQKITYIDTYSLSPLVSSSVFQSRKDNGSSDKSQSEEYKIA